MSTIIWHTPECDSALADNLAKELGVSKTIARILVNRGLTTAEDARAFLHPSLDHLHDPFLLPDMEQGVERVVKALENGEKILVHGDYDVDGVTSAALLIRTLGKLGANVVHRVPHRKKEGYDIKPWTAEQAHADGVTLIITADCGVTACETIERAQSLGIDIVVTDHHEPGEELPNAVAVINPRRKDSTYPFPHLAGVGVALKFGQALVRRLGHNDLKYVERYLDLAALGTIADVMPLLGENRAIAKFGLDAIGKSKKIGIQAMLKRSGLAGKHTTSYMVGFVLGPRINAVGRLDDATIALQLFLTSDGEEADSLVEILEQRNVERQEEQARILEEVQAQLGGKDLSEMRALVLSAPGWNSGVVGIVASKVVEQYSRPAILLCENEDGSASGSGRSVEIFNLINALRECERLQLVKAGGHALAAGVRLKMENFAEFEAKLNELALEVIAPEDMVPHLATDGELDPEEVSWEMLHDIRQLEPFGAGNPEPVFVSRSLKVVESRRVGSAGNHLKMRVSRESGQPVDCIAFGMGDYEHVAQLGQEVAMCYNIKSNHYNGHDSLQLMVKDLKPGGGEESSK